MGSFELMGQHIGRFTNNLNILDNRKKQDFTLQKFIFGNTLCKFFHIANSGQHVFQASPILNFLSHKSRLYHSLQSVVQKAVKFLPPPNPLFGEAKPPAGKSYQRI